MLVRVITMARNFDCAKMHDPDCILIFKKFCKAPGKLTKRVLGAGGSHGTLCVVAIVFPKGILALARSAGL
jgi:hypothetical protein